MEDYVGLNIGGTGGDDSQPEKCPDCGQIHPPVDEEAKAISERIFLSYLATKDVPPELLMGILNGTHHIHIVLNEECEENGPEG